MPAFGTQMPDYTPSGGKGAKRLRKNEPDTPFMAETFGELQAKIVSTIALVLDAGGAIHFGMTSDAGALLVRAWLGGDKYEDYCSSPAQFVETLEALQGEAEGAAHRKPSTSPKGPRTRS